MKSIGSLNRWGILPISIKVEPIGFLIPLPPRPDQRAAKQLALQELLPAPAWGKLYNNKHNATS